MTMPEDIEKKLRQLVKDHFKDHLPKFEPLAEAEKFKLKAARKNAKEPAEIIDLKPGRDEKGMMIFQHVNGKWRNGAYERRKAEEDNKRIKVEQEGKDRI